MSEPNLTKKAKLNTNNDPKKALHSNHNSNVNDPANLVKHNNTKKNKKPQQNSGDAIWKNIEDAFLPELLEEQRSRIESSTATAEINDDDYDDIPKRSVNILNSMSIDDDDDGADLDGTTITVPEYINHSPKPTATTISAPTALRLSSLFIKPDMDVECLYRKSGIRENCDVCSSDVVLTDDGFLTCKNPACSILYKDESLDQTAEWRYYGADDNQASDPTRCGMPVNPLLVESSYGCKVMCEGGSYSQDMMKIRRYTEW